MTSKIKVDNIENQCGGAVVTKCGGTTTINGTTVVASAAVKTNAYQASDGGNIIDQSGSTITLGASGDTIQLAGGASQSGFGRSGSVNWITTPKTATFTAVSGEGYFCNTAGGTFELDLPAGSAGAIVSIQDYNNTFDSNKLTVDPNGSEKINGGDAGEPVDLTTEGRGVTFVYVDSTVGWRSVQDNDFTKKGEAINYICAAVSGSGNTLATVCTNFKVATFTGPGTFTVNSVASCAPNNIVSYMIVAGGGGSQEGGGGAGGFREFKSPVTPYTNSCMGQSSPITVTAQGYGVVVGAGGTKGDGAPAPTPPNGNGQPGGTSSVFGITSAGGGGGGRYTNNPSDRNKGIPGGSGGGSAAYPGPAPTTVGGNGNDPSVSPGQGNNGGPSNGGYPNFGGAGGGATAVGTTGDPNGAPGGDGTLSSITGASVGYAGGGGGGIASTVPAGSPTPATFGGGTGANTTTGPTNATNGTANRGGGAGGTWSAPGTLGGSGIVVIRYKFQ